MATQPKSILIKNRDTGVEFDPCVEARYLANSAAELSAEARNKTSKSGTISADINLNLRWPSDPELKESILAIENVMAYYSINSSKIANKNSILNTSLTSVQGYYESVLKMLKDCMCKYLSRSLTNRCFDGKVGRNTHFSVDLVRTATNYDLHLYSIKRIVMGKHGKAKDGHKTNNYFEFVFDDDGNLVDKSIVAETMTAKFTEETSLLVLDDIGVLLDRFNRSIDRIADNAQRQTLSYKFKNHKNKLADSGENLLAKLSTLQNSLSTQEVQNDG